jgi:hypothetical protein
VVHVFNFALGGGNPQHTVSVEKHIRFVSKHIRSSTR